MTEEITQEQQPEIRTEVTSIAREEAKTGQHIPLPSAEKLVENASVDIFRTRKSLYDVFARMSKKAMLRTLTAIFSLPEDDVPVRLVTEDEKLAYALAQRNTMSRFTVMQYEVLQERKRLKEEQEKAQQEQQTTEEVKEETTNE